MVDLRDTATLFDVLKRNGFELPKECRDVRLVMPIDGVYQLHYEVNLTAEDLIAIGKALQEIGQPHVPRLSPLRCGQPVSVGGGCHGYEDEPCVKTLGHEGPCGL